MNVGMWAKALQIIPKIDKAEWDRLDIISRWLISTRAAVLIMTFFSATIAGILAFGAGKFNLLNYLLLVIGLVFAHATNNLLNDLTDYDRGVDRDNYFRTQYGPQALEQGLMTRRELLTYAAVTGLIALAAGGVPGVAARLAGAGAAGGRRFLRAVLHLAAEIHWPGRNCGDPGLGPADDRRRLFRHHRAVGLECGPGRAALRARPTTVIFGKHIDKLREDKAKGIHTLPVIIGEKAARYTRDGHDRPAVPAGDRPGDHRLLYPGHADRAAGAGPQPLDLGAAVAAQTRAAPRPKTAPAGRCGLSRRSSSTTACTACCSCLA